MYEVDIKLDMKMKGIVVTCFCIVYSAFGQEKTAYNGNQLWKIDNDNKTTLQLLESLEREKYLEVWRSNLTQVDAMVNAEFVEKVKEKLLENNLRYEVTIKDVQKVIDEENTKSDEDLQLRLNYRLTWNHYHDVDDIYDYLQYLAQTYPKLCTLRTIGISVERRPIKLLKVSNGNPNNKAIFVEGGIYSNEWISPAAVTYIINRLVTNYEYEPSFIRNIDWYFVPVLNPDGYQHSYYLERLWRKNRSKSGGECVGVDLNRNFGYDWGRTGSSGDPCHTHYRGRKPFSEPETAAIANFFINNPSVKWVGYVAIQAYGQYIAYPWGSPNALVDEYEELNKIGTEAATNIILAGGESYAVSPAGLIQPSSGISMDWARGDQAIKYAFTLKLRDQGHYGVLLPARFIKPSSEEALIAIKTIAKAIRI